MKYINQRQKQEGTNLYKLVENYEDIIQNYKEFHNNIDEEIIRKLSFFRHWYYLEEMDLFAPSKFIGYKDMTVEGYKIGTNPEHGYMDGRETVPKMKRWFRLVTDEEFDVYYEKLEDFLSQYDKKPNKKLQLYRKK